MMSNKFTEKNGEMEIDDLDEVEKAFCKEDFKITLNLKSMEKDKLYSILKTERKPTKFGDRLLVQLEDFQIFLPERFNALSDEIIEKMKDMKYAIVNEGPVGRTFKIKLRRNYLEEIEEQNILNPLGFYVENFGK